MSQKQKRIDDLKYNLRQKVFAGEGRDGISEDLAKRIWRLENGHPEFGYNDTP